MAKRSVRASAPPHTRQRQGCVWQPAPRQKLRTGCVGKSTAQGQWEDSASSSWPEAQRVPDLEWAGPRAQGFRVYGSEAESGGLVTQEQRLRSWAAPKLSIFLPPSWLLLCSPEARLSSPPLLPAARPARVRLSPSLLSPALSVLGLQAAGFSPSLPVLGWGWGTRSQRGLGLRFNTLLLSEASSLPRHFL